MSALTESHDPHDWVAWVLHQTGSQGLLESTKLQNLWGGYGELLRLKLAGGPAESVILKKVIPPSGDIETVSDQRKRRSYSVEQAWYRHWAPRCDDTCRVARCLGLLQHHDSSWLLLEDLGTAGFYPIRPPRSEHVRAGLVWLAHFHSRFLAEVPKGLWEQGTYWHLATRREEWARMPAGPLNHQAAIIDQRLRTSRFQTLVHGDAKPANFCWTANSKAAAAVDFQYVGGGCGIRDVAYFLDSCLGDEGCDSQADECLELYFSTLRAALGREARPVDPSEIEKEWRDLFPFAWADFCRFEQGWRGPTALGRYSQRQVDRALALL